MAISAPNEFIVTYGGGWCCIEEFRILLKTFCVIENNCCVVQNCGFQEAFVCNVGAYGGCKYDSAHNAMLQFVATQ